MSLSMSVVLMSLQECTTSRGNSTPYVVCTATKRRSLQRRASSHTETIWLHFPPTDDGDRR